MKPGEIIGSVVSGLVVAVLLTIARQLAELRKDLRRFMGQHDKLIRAAHRHNARGRVIHVFRENGED